MKRLPTKPSAIRTLPDDRLATITGGGNLKGTNVAHALSASPTGIGRAYATPDLIQQIQLTAYTDDGKTLA